jgi:hypothetical protein
VMPALRLSGLCAGQRYVADRRVGPQLLGSTELSAT